MPNESGERSENAGGLKAMLKRVAGLAEHRIDLEEHERQVVLAERRRRSGVRRRLVKSRRARNRRARAARRVNRLRRG